MSRQEFEKYIIETGVRVFGPYYNKLAIIFLIFLRLMFVRKYMKSTYVHASFAEHRTTQNKIISNKFVEYVANLKYMKMIII